MHIKDAQKEVDNLLEMLKQHCLRLKLHLNSADERKLYVMIGREDTLEVIEDDGGDGLCC